ncbi:MAG TPA: ABC transporter substrate-binding protein [Candidatus Binatia bacterium]|nr:ABC transporter substrate-binding protein [Candidatus Binatia bacterium]
MKRKISAFTLSAMLSALSFLGAVLPAVCSSAESQPIKKVYRLGVLSPSSPPAPEAPAAPNLIPKFLNELGYIEGQNLVVHRLFGDGKLDRLAHLAKDLVELRVDVIIAVSPTAIQSAKYATKTIPIVMGFGKDPVRDGFIATMARPGGNITGVVVAPEDVLAGKRLELIKEAVPSAEGVAVLATSEFSSKLQIQEAYKVAAFLGVKLIVVEAQNVGYDSVFAAMTKERAKALFVLASPILNVDRDRIIQLAAKHRLPAIYEWPEHVDAGGMMAYGSSLAGLSRRVAAYVDRILKGARPADLPVEQPMKFEFVINLKTAKQIGHTIPPNVVARADRVIR